MENLSEASFWSLRGRSSDSFLCIVGNGRDAWFWHDNWTPFGPLIKYFGEHGPRSLRVPITARVADVCNANGWTIAHPRSDQGESLQIYLSSIQLPTSVSNSDHFEWVIERKSTNGFSSSKTWEQLRPREDEKAWAPLIWFKGHIPKHAFHLWITNLDRLPTMARLASWGLDVSTVCSLCSASIENRDHLFLECAFARILWKKILERIGHPQIFFSDWNSMLVWVKSYIIPPVRSDQLPESSFKKKPATCR
ncbi:uncharacterized protein LOC110225772 [Arabidopsis lyrata subsp. lyrata]|uniref:uncharacterized protein LOC110225772 n=1 Tax=Arabidopsis lyrata subsp. lyrata TaxID=81972 RepID=UPI000A29BF45|nr:uncharacterized protein LOC110225772 [Arabidopsis lyrata subsp. lyrata]|eukprot:XP_020871402.1 uncharacterized protein LOC110225772 [Arabidopsis lyrata subsp. lyrata]